MATTNPKVDGFISRSSQWQQEYTELRRFLLESELSEDLKWGVPCYTLNGKNVVIMHGFKDYCALLFVKGSLMKDPAGLMIQQTENVQAGRQVRFTNLDQIVELAPVLKAYINEAFELEKSGAKIIHRSTSDYKVPEEFKTKLEEMPALKTAFEALTPGRQRGYLLFFDSPKLSATRAARVAKAIPQILAGKGLND